MQVVIRPESVAIGLAPAREPHAEARGGRALVLRPRPAPELELPSGLRLRSRRLGFPTWHPGDRVRVWIDGPVSAREPD